MTKWWESYQKGYAAKITREIWLMISELGAHIRQEGWVDVELLYPACSPITQIRAVRKGI